MACHFCFFPQSLGHIGHSVSSSLPVIVNINDYSYGSFELFIDHSINEHLKGFESATIFSNENSLLISFNLEKEAPFFKKPLHLCLEPHPVKHPYCQFPCNFNIFQDSNLMFFYSCNTDERSIRHYLPTS